MTVPDQLASALNRVHEIAKKQGGNIVLSADIERSDREFLVRMGWLQEIIKGWYMLVKPDVHTGESTIWYANFWDFIRIYLEHHHGEDYCLSAENSLELHVGSCAIPRQVIAITARGGGQPQELLFNTSIFAYAAPDSLPKEKTKIQGLQVMSLPYALCKTTPTFFKTNPTEAIIALKSSRSHYDFVEVILKNKFKRPASRIVGAYRFLGDEAMADSIEHDLRQSGILIHAENPFSNLESFSKQPRMRSPYAARIFTMWESYRKDVIEHFPPPKKLPRNPEKYLKVIEDIYAQDAYNSLSIEGYRVNQELIERVQQQNWNPELNLQDMKERDALAARGYFEAFGEVKKSIAAILNNADPALVIERDLAKWYRALFQPSMRAGIISEDMLYGYRKGPVFIRNSRHVPLPKEALLDAMEALFTCIKEESHAGVKSVLGHFIFVFIHPYMDGNGRTGRFLMNALASSGGYPWTIIRVNQRAQYFKALEAASVDKQIIPFTQFIVSEMQQFENVKRK